MLDRSTPPCLQPYPAIQLSMPAWQRLTNGVQMCVINHGDVDVNQIDVYFEGGVLEQPKRYVAQLLAAMIDKGSSKYSAEEIAEQMAFYGALKGGSVSDHHIKLSLRCTGNNLPVLMPIFFDYITTPQFNQKEFSNIVEQMRDNAIVESRRVASLASIRLSQMLYGEQSMMANEPEAKSIGNVGIADLRAFHNAHFAPASCRVVLSGKVTPAIAAEVTRWFESWSERPVQPLAPWNCRCTHSRREVINVPQALQSGIAAAIPAIGRQHPDYIGLRILTTAFGGYFGSRLMSNIREDKGYTYCIHAYLDIGVSPHPHKHINLLVYALRRVTPAIAYCACAVKVPPELLQLRLWHLSLIGRILKSAYGQQSVIVGHWDTFSLNSRLFSAHRSIRGMGGLSSALLR